MKTAAMRKFIGADFDDGVTPGKAKAFAKSAGRTAENIVLRLPLPRIQRVIENFRPPVRVLRFYLLFPSSNSLNRLYHP